MIGNIIIKNLIQRTETGASTAENDAFTQKSSNLGIIASSITLGVHSLLAKREGVRPREYSDSYRADNPISLGL